MDIRRLNDVLKIVGSSGAVAAVTPLFAREYKSWNEFLLTLVPVVTGLFMAWLSGWGTRAKGTEYQDVADAKAVLKASLTPPPMSVIIAPSIPSRPPPPPTEAM